MRPIKFLWSFITLRSWRAARRRRRYEEIKALIVEQHLSGKGGMIVPRKYDRQDLLSFHPPMYALARNQNNEPCIFWRKELMSVEVGPPRAVAAPQDEIH